MRFALVLVCIAAPASALPVCKPNQLSLGFDAENGNFDGMSHSGTLLVLRNLGPAPCQLPAFPTLALETAKGEALPLQPTRQGSAAPVRLAAGAEATAGLRWVSSPVYSHNRCLKPAQLRLSWSGGSLRQAFTGTLCGPGNAPARLTQPPLALDPPPPA
ncbi:DUF4232 domain-containing protein [Acidocella facilis]|uniref:DUF4232 domain-containing protein n=1 Tax=Acidocella facilis TaxID=525 RepID=UPI00047AE1FC|nr:DUF4232 domain-containing protein [Acidocella facilis]